MIDIFSYLWRRFSVVIPTKRSSENRKSAKHISHLRENFEAPEPTPDQEKPLLRQQSLIEPAFPALVTANRSPYRTASQLSRRENHLVKSAGHWNKSILNTVELWELFDKIDNSMAIIRYAICGLGSLIDHGFRGRCANKVTILVPAEAKDVIKSWAIAHGGELNKNSDGCIGVAMRDGSIRQVRVKYLDDGFDRLQIQQSRHSSAKVLGLASQLEHISAAYLLETQKCRTTSGGLPDRGSKLIKTIVSDIMWCLRRASESRTLLPEDKLPGFLSAAFWAAFGVQYPESKIDCARAGINIQAALDRHREEERMRRDVNENNEFLACYGIPGMDVVEQESAPFKGIHGLRWKDIPSIYTPSQQ